MLLININNFNWFNFISYDYYFIFIISYTMNKGIYLTDLKFEKVKEEEATPLRRLKKSKSSSKILLKSDQLENKSEKAKTLKKTKKDFLDFMVNEQTKYADLDKIEEFYQSNALSEFNVYNKNSLTMNEKNKYLEHLNMLIEQEIVNLVVLSDSDSLKNYNNQILKYKHDITFLEHDLETFSNIKSSLYKTNVIFAKI